MTNRIQIREVRSFGGSSTIDKITQSVAKVAIAATNITITKERSAFWIFSLDVSWRYGHGTSDQADEGKSNLHVDFGLI